MRTGSVDEVRDRMLEAGLVKRDGIDGLECTAFGLDALAALLGMFALTLRDDELTEICSALAGIAMNEPSLLRGSSS